jgi:D-alanyl-D-alanine carboxypeptidase
MRNFFENLKHIAFIIIGIIFVGGAIIFFTFFKDERIFSFSVGDNATTTNSQATSTQFGSDSLTQNTRPSNKRLPVRKWDVLDPSVEAQGILIQSLDENFPFLRYHVRDPWPAASLTKLMTAVVVLENYGDKKKVLITNKAMEAEGVAGGVQTGEEYLSGDLIKVMLLASSNRAAAAFEEFAGGKAEFNRLLNKKAGELGMTDTIFNDGSGLSDLNLTTAEDMLKLLKYIYTNHPEILNWTRLEGYLVQPTNTTESRTVQNIDPFVGDKNFLGGKTGTSPSANQNFAGIFSFKDFRVAVIILGSPDRVKEIKSYFSWIEGAYNF